MRKQQKQMKGYGGITLIALVITIIVILILAGVSITMLTGNNGILTRAAETSENTRGSEVQEKVNLAVYENLLESYSGGTKKSRDDVIQELYGDGLLTDEEVAKLADVDTIIIGSITVDFSELGSVEGITLGSIYTDEMIGQSITYSSNGQNDWIVFGKDESGNILITTELPIDNAYDLYGSAEKWLTYEDDLNDACSGYGATIQGVSVSSRSITLEDINYVSGFTEPDFDTYTFSSTSDYSNKYVNYYYPSLDASSNSYWQNPSNASTTFENNAYYYYCSWSSGEYLYGYSGTDWYDTSADGLIANTDNLQYIWGGNTSETCYNTYLVASRSVDVYSSYAAFSVALVGDSGVGTGSYYLCYSNSAGGYDDGSLGSYGVRPVVVLPSNLLVEDQGDGTYDLAS